ncbi:PSP1 C-terminal conserved region-domain-containing protein [Cokeromyces recurvatus]|uniref:PSP1 C-terminal conserved region-domain-containing protein n=1 Tax=Cokeromyces recurvatus TaxID=90255 RepID=UPI0022200829|nr:PSP1 C-terminal conserved region-domain-containing protein [Cokeromyces recurvatus]KAI7904084.1 PSP1 C-terminal conserved region-domain-containing protein [Cokeromyces recurvatus]
MSQQAFEQQKNKPKAISEEENNFMGIPIINNPNSDNAWKIVGSPSRRGSTINTPQVLDNTSKNSPNDSPINDNVDIMRRASVVSEGNNNNWGSFGGFQWEGPSIFDEDGKPVSAPPIQPPPPDVVDNQGVSLLHNTNYDILSVPMLPGVSLEPIYRQHRSLSFSMGQDPTFFGYDDYDDHPPQPAYQPPFKSSLAPMEEEEDGFFDDIDFSHIRSRSKSSGAAFGLLSQSQHSRLMNSDGVRRGSEQQEDLMINQRRRSSSRFFNISNTVEPTTPTTPNASQMSLGDKERLDILQRRLSQQSQFQDYSFPAESSPNNYNLMRRQSLTLNTQPPSNIQQLAEQLENVHLRPDLQTLGSFHPPPPPPQQQQLQLQQQQPTQPQYKPDLYTQHLQQQPFFNNGYFHLQQQQQQQQQFFSPNQQQQQQVAEDYFDTDPKCFQDLGKGIPMHRLDPKVPLYMVEFKGGRTDFFYVLDSKQFHPQVGDLVIVEADRGKDLGKVAVNTLTIEQVIALEQKRQSQLQQVESNTAAAAAAEKEKREEEESAAAGSSIPVKAQREIHIKRIFRLATSDEVNLLLVKGQDEHKALVVCQQKTKQRKLPMEVVDAEYQWDRRKLTFYFEAENRIDFRELVRELFKIYKTRIWMCVVTPPITIDDIHSLDNTTTLSKS